MLNPKKTDLLLGTALWSWTIQKSTCFELLDEFYASGYRIVDCASNYPINKDPGYFRAAESIIEEWLKVNQVNDLSLLMKVGSLDNSGSPINNLSKSFLLMSYDYYKFKFENNLNQIMVHWDNRNAEKEIEETVEALVSINSKKTEIGLSGIAHPHIYYNLLQALHLKVSIQMKHNIFISDYEKYRSFHGTKAFIAYGINSGGIKLNNNYAQNSSATIRGVNMKNYEVQLNRLTTVMEDIKINYPQLEISSLNSIGMINAYHHPDMSGILIGPSTPAQLKESILLFRKLNQTEYIHIYQKIQSIT